MWGIFSVVVIKGFNQPKANERENYTEKAMSPDANLLAESKLFGNVKSFKQSRLSGVFTGQPVRIISILLLLEFQSSWGS